MAVTVRIREHQFNELGWCINCGAGTWDRVTEWLKKRSHTIPDTDTRQCVWREQPDKPRAMMRPAPHEDADAISARIVELSALAEQAYIVKNCAGRLGMPKAQCHQCGENDACKTCAIKHALPMSGCWCYRGEGITSLPCPT